MRGSNNTRISGVPLAATVIHRVEIDTPHDLVNARLLLQQNPAYCRYV
jgi:hypothetical protein